MGLVAPLRRRLRQHNLCVYARAASNSASAKSSPQLASNEELSAIITRFPPGIDYAFGYGSGVLRQSQSPSTSQQTTDVNTNNSPGMVDVILAVENPYEWHKCNLQSHPDHYSWMARMGGPQFVNWLQINFGAKVYFHPFVDIDCGSPQTENNANAIQRQIKYGVVSTDDFIQDLLNWDYLYLAGRMHKPIVPIAVVEQPEEAVIRVDEIENAQRSNILSAVSASLLLQDAARNETHLSSVQSIPAKQLYNTIAGLSYEGDIRMQTGTEDPNKVEKLVETPGMINLWENMYSETLSGLQGLGLLSVIDSSRANDALVCLQNLI